MTRTDALTLLKSHAKARSFIKHCLACEAWRKGASTDKLSAEVFRE